MKILVFGSSSTRNFQLTDELKHINPDFRDFEIKAIAMSGATITGFGKRNSSLNVRDNLIKAFHDFNPDYLCFALGQTDIELGIYYKRVVKMQEIDISDFIQETTKNYIQYINDITNELKISNEKILIKGVNPPVITKYRTKSINYTAREILRNDFPISEKKQYKDKLKSIYPSVYERYNNHKNFNLEIKKTSKKHGIEKYFDIDDIVEDKNNPIHVRSEFIAAGMDHHIIDSLFIRECFIRRLIQTIYQ